MAGESDRVTVTTYVPAEQRDVWREDAEALGMSQSEFLRTMVQAGRRDFTFGDGERRAEEPDVARANPRGSDVKNTVLEILREEGPLGWGELVDALTADVENELESGLIELQEADRIAHSPRDGTYDLAGASDGE